MSRDDQDRVSTPARARRQSHVPLFRAERNGEKPLIEPLAFDHRSGREIFTDLPHLTELNPRRVWESITEISPDPGQLARNGLFLNSEQHPATQIFDMLRTRVLQAMAKEGWTRLAITSPGHGCGKSFVAANLALALARLPSCRTVLLDLELRAPKLADLFALEAPQPLLDFIMGEQPLEAQFCRIGQNLALGLNGAPVDMAAETLQDPQFSNAMAALRDLLQPDIIVIDTPPALASDDVIAMAGEVDAVLLVSDGTRSSAAEVQECERLFGDRIPLLGVVLNRAQDLGLGRNRYGKR